MGYTREEIIQKCEEAFKNIATFYQADVINYRGKTSDTKELFNEIVAEFVIKNIKAFQTTIPQITRKTSYKTEGHDGVTIKQTIRKEEIIAKEIFTQSKENGAYAYIGKIIDYQTPLKSKKKHLLPNGSEIVVGKIDLLSYDEATNTIRVLELKAPDKKETMLRCVLEAFTYKQTADWGKLIEDFNKSKLLKDCGVCTLPLNSEIKASPFVFKGEEQYREMQDTSRKNLHKLMKLLDSTPYYITKNNGIYTVGI